MQRGSSSADMSASSAGGAPRRARAATISTALSRPLLSGGLSSPYAVSCLMYTAVHHGQIEN